MRSGAQPATSDSQPVREGNAEGSPRPTLADDGYVITTYRYVRLAIVIVIFALFISLVMERTHATCWNGSISAYYYTPVHSMFVASLAVIGVAFFAIRGENLWEEILLNMAGFLAPVVAFVPTGWSSDDCPSNLDATSKTALDNLLTGNRFFEKFSSNNLLALIIGGLVAVAITLAVTSFHRRNENGASRWHADKTEVLVPALGSVVVVIAGLIWHKVWPASFSTHAHSYAAILMFFLVGIVMVSTAVRTTKPQYIYKSVYFLCPAVMAAGVLVVSVSGALTTWRHQVLILETVALIPFVVFWLFQTIQLWDKRPPVPGSA